jgi:hypothetical protein
MTEDQKNQIKKLEDYLKKGYINQEEFDIKKNGILGTSNNAPKNNDLSKKINEVNELNSKLNNKLKSLSEDQLNSLISLLKDLTN